MATIASRIAAPVEVTHHQGVAIVSLNRTDRRNSLTSEARQQLTGIIDNAAHDPTTCAIVLASQDCTFSAGQDLDEAKDFPSSFIPTWIREHMDLYRAIVRYTRPIIAAVDGCCVGAGLQAALLCDLRLGSPSAYFTMPELDDAIPCILGVWTLWDTIGRSRTYEMVLTNRRILAEEALSWGILNGIVPSSSDLLPRAIELALHLSCKPRLAFELTKQRLADLTLQQCEFLEVHATSAHMQAFASGEPRRAMLSFLAGHRTNGPAWLGGFYKNKDASI